MEGAVEVYEECVLIDNRCCLSRVCGSWLPGADLGRENLIGGVRASVWVIGDAVRDERGNFGDE